MNNPLAKPTEPPLDPDYAVKDRKEARRFWGALALAIIAIIGTTYAVIGTREAKTEITQIQHSACAEDPASLECQQIKAESDRKQPVVFACIPIRKIAKDQRLLTLTKCKEAAERAETNSGSKGVVPSTTGNSPSSEPGPSPGGHTGGSVGGSKPEHNPSGTGNPPEESPPKVSETAPKSETPTPESSSPVTQESATPAAPKQPVREAVGGVVEGVGTVVCSVNKLGIEICR